MAAHASRRLGAMVANASAIIGIELMTAAQGCDFHANLRSSAPLESVRKIVRERIPSLADDRYIHADLQSAIELVRSRAVIGAVAGIGLPSLTEQP